MGKNILTCPNCQQTISIKYNFCPYCGYNLKAGQVKISFLVQFGLYALAIFLPPLGLWPGAKYMLKKNHQAKRVGLITIILTIISTILTIWAIFTFFNDYLGQMNAILYGS